jgi:hypothetical protein
MVILPYNMVTVNIVWQGSAVIKEKITKPVKHKGARDITPSYLQALPFLSMLVPINTDYDNKKDLPRAPPPGLTRVRHKADKVRPSLQEQVTPCSFRSPIKHYKGTRPSNNQQGDERIKSRGNLPTDQKGGIAESWNIGRLGLDFVKPA